MGIMEKKMETTTWHIVKHKLSTIERTIRYNPTIDRSMTSASAVPTYCCVSPANRARAMSPRLSPQVSSPNLSGWVVNQRSQHGGRLETGTVFGIMDFAKKSHGLQHCNNLFEEPILKCTENVDPSLWKIRGVYVASLMFGEC